MTLCNFLSIFFILCFIGFNVYTFVDLVKRGVLTLVGETRRYRNDRPVIIITLLLARGLSEIRRASIG